MVTKVIIAETRPEGKRETITEGLRGYCPRFDGSRGRIGGETCGRRTHEFWSGTDGGDEVSGAEDLEVALELGVDFGAVDDGAAISVSADLAEGNGRSSSSISLLTLLCSTAIMGHKMNHYI